MIQNSKDELIKGYTRKKQKKVLETSCYLSTAQPHFSFCSAIPQDLLFLTPDSHSYAVGTALEGSGKIKLIIRT